MSPSLRPEGEEWGTVRGARSIRRPHRSPRTFSRYVRQPRCPRKACAPARATGTTMTNVRIRGSNRKNRNTTSARRIFRITNTPTVSLTFYHTITYAPLPPRPHALLRANQPAQKSHFCAQKSHFSRTNSTRSPPAGRMSSSGGWHGQADWATQPPTCRRRIVAGDFACCGDKGPGLLPTAGRSAPARCPRCQAKGGGRTRCAVDSPNAQLSVPQPSPGGRRLGHLLGALVSWW